MSPDSSTTGPAKQALPHPLLLKNISAAALELLVALCPLLFVVLAFCANDLHGRHVSEWGEKVQQVTKYGSTVFPIVFASVLGMAIRSIARWRAERGTTLRELELLMGSQTLGGTISTQIGTLGLSNDFVLGFGLLVFWLLSPIAAQACLRMVEIGQVTTVSFGNVTYADMQNRTSFAVGDDPFRVRSIYNTLYQLSLISPGSYRTQSRDLWENVKIPMLESLDASMVVEGGWIPVDTQDSDSNITYTSLIGVPVIGLPKLNMSEERTNKTLTALMTYFSLETNYFAFGCSDISIVDPKDILKDYSGFLYNETSPPPNITFFLETSTPLDRDLTPGLLPRSVRFVSNYGSWRVQEDESIIYKSAVVDCSVTQTYVELAVECYYEFCETIGIRKSRLPHDPPEYTPLDTNGHMRDIAKELAYRGINLEGATSHDVWHGTLTEYFLYDPSTVGSLIGYDRDISELSRDVFTARFSLVFNTYWNAALSPHFLINPNVANELDVIHAVFRDHDPSIFFRTATTNTTIELTMDRYVRTVWAMTTLMAASCLLLITAAVGTSLRWKCVGPNVLGYVSTLLVGRRGSALDGPERAKAFADTRVGLVVVADGGKGHGAVVFSPLPRLPDEPEEALLAGR